MNASFQNVTDASLPSSLQRGTTTFTPDRKLSHVNTAASHLRCPSTSKSTNTLIQTKSHLFVGRTHNNFKKKDYRLLNTMSESEHFNTLLGIVEKLKRPYSQSESALQVEAINDQQENLSIQPESENQNQTTTLKHVEESDHQQCKSTQSTNVTLSNSLSFSLSNCDQSRLQDISLSKKSLLLQTSQHVIDFVNQNETECAKLLSNNWAPMKRRRITHAQKMEMLNNQQASTQQQNSNMVSQEDFSFSCDNQQKSKHEKTIHQNQDLQYRLNDNFFKNLENQQISTDSYPNAQSNLQDYFQGPQNIQYQQEKLNLPEDRYTNLNYNNVVIKSQNQINNIDESQNNQRVQGNNKNESNIVKPIFNKPLISLQQQQGSQVFPMTSGLPYMNQSLVTNINNHNQYQQQQIFANNLIFQRQQQQAIIASSIASEKQHLFYGVPNMNNVAGLRAQQQVILVQNPNQSYFYNPNLIPQYGMGMYYQNKQISNTQSNQ
eukprot:403368092